MGFLTQKMVGKDLQNTTHVHVSYAACAAHQRYLVSRHVLLDVGFLSEGTATDNALKWLFPSVCPEVLLEVKVLGEQLVAVLTLECASLLLRAVTSPGTTASPTGHSMTVHCHPRVGCSLGLR